MPAIAAAMVGGMAGGVEGYAKKPLGRRFEDRFAGGLSAASGLDMLFPRFVAANYYRCSDCTFKHVSGDLPIAGEPRVPSLHTRLLPECRLCERFPRSRRSFELLTGNLENASCLSWGERDDFRLELPVFAECEQADSHRQIKPARAAGAGVEVEHAFLLDVIRDVSVAVEDGGKFGCGGVEVEGLEVVEHVEVEAGVGRILDEDDFGLGELGAGAFGVDVAANGGYGSDFSEFVEDGNFSYVATVKDAVDAREGGAAQCGKDLGAEQAVGIRDDSEFHVFRISRAGGGRLREGARKLR